MSAKSTSPPPSGNGSFAHGITGHHVGTGAAGGPDQAHLAYIDGLRGIAVLLVLSFHVWIFSGNPSPAENAAWWNPVANGYIGVNLFLVISGFCICWPYVNGKTFLLPEFAVRRALRLMPPYLAALGLFIILALAFSRLHWWWPEWPNATGLPAAKTGIIHAFLLHNLLRNHILSINGSFWSLALEAQLYLTVPVLLLLAKKIHPAAAVGVAFVVSMTFRFAANYWAHGIQGMEAWNTYGFTIMRSLPSRWFEFSLGMGGAFLLKERRWRKGWVYLTVAAVVFLLAGSWLVYATSEMHPFVDPLFGFGFFLLLMAGGVTGNNPLRHLLTSSSLTALGTISFSFYLIHQPMVRLLCVWVRSWIDSPRCAFGISMALGLPMTIVLAIVFYFTIEVRAHAAAKRFAAAWAAKQVWRPCQGAPRGSSDFGLGSQEIR